MPRRQSESFYWKSFAHHLQMELSTSSLLYFEDGFPTWNHFTEDLAQIVHTWNLADVRSFILKLIFRKSNQCTENLPPNIYEWNRRETHSFIL